MGFGSLSNYTRFLLTQELARARGEKSYKLNEDAQNSTYTPPKWSGYNASTGEENSND